MQNYRLFIPCIFCTYCNKFYQRMQLFILCIYFLFYPTCFGLSWVHHQGYPKLFFLYTAIWFMQCLCCSSACACGLVCRGGFTVHKPIIRGVSSCFFIYSTIWFMQCLCCSSACACGLVCRDGFTVQTRQTSPQAHADEQHKHCMDQMVVYNKQLEIPLMMGLWEPETCRVKIK